MSSGAGGRPQPVMNARRLGRSEVCAHPGRVSNPTSWYCAASGPAGGLAGGAGSGLGATGAHAAASRISVRDALRRMWVIYLEIGFALGLAVFIVWWTWPRKK